MSWPTRRLGDVCSIAIGRTPSRAEPRFWGLGHPWISIADLNQGRHVRHTKETITEAAISECRCRPVSPGTVLLSFKLSIGKVSVTDEAAFTNEAIAALPINDPGVLYRDFLYWALRTIRLTDDSNTAVMGATLNSRSLAAIRIPLPPLDEQRRIADVLDRADALRAKRRETLTRLDELTQSIFVDMFGGKGDWPRRPLGELLSRIDSGRSPTCAGRVAGDSELGVLKLGAVSFGHYRAAENKAVLANSDVSQAHEVSAGDVLLSRKNTSELVGASVFVEETRPGLHMPDLIFRLVPDRASGLRPRYLRDALAAPASRQAIRALTGGSAASMVNISKAKLKTVAIAVPDDATQARYVSRIEDVRACQRLAGRELALLDELFASLQQRAFRGDLFSSPLPPELTDAVA